MIGSQTVFVVGAGASAEVGLPVGSDLRARISRMLDLDMDDFGRLAEARGNRHIRDFFHAHIQPDRRIQFVEACQRVSRGIMLFPSIDDFLLTHGHDEQMVSCGKLAVAGAILEAEARSRLRFERKSVTDTIEFASLEDAWYLPFFHLLVRGVGHADRNRVFDRVTVINFNYDRCLEHFLVHAFCAAYQVQIHEGRSAVLSQLKMFHPYGSVGKYLGSSTPDVDFGKVGLSQLEAGIGQIRTYSERVDDAASVAEIRKSVVEAETIVFLGNQFHPINMELIAPIEPAQSRKRIYFTREGISDEDLHVVHRLLRKLYGKGSEYTPRSNEGFHPSTTCAKLFKDYHLSLRA